jgi:hypothetical protein
LEVAFEKETNLGENGSQPNFWNVNRKAINWAKENKNLSEKYTYMFETLDIYLIALKTWLQTCPNKSDEKEINKLLEEAMKKAKYSKSFESNGFEAVIAEEKDLASHTKLTYKRFKGKLTKFYINLVVKKFPLERCSMDDFASFKNHWDSLILNHQRNPTKNLHPIAWYHEFSEKYDPSARIKEMLNDQKENCQRNPPICPNKWSAKNEVEKKEKNEAMIDIILKEERLTYSTTVLEFYFE